MHTKIVNYLRQKKEKKLIAIELYKQINVWVWQSSCFEKQVEMEINKEIEI